MTAASLRAAWILLPAFLAIPLEASAVWVCHGPNGTTWQQEYPPCVAPVQEPAQRPQRVEAAPPPAPRKAPTQTQSTSADYSVPSWQRSSADEKASYDRLLTELEGRYPAINPDSPAFNQAAHDRVVEQLKRNKAVGMKSTAALQSAVETVLPRPAPAPAIADPAPAQFNPKPDDLPNTWARAAATVAVVTASVVLGKLLLKALGWLWRSLVGVAGTAATVASNTSAHDIARAAGAAAAVAQKKSAGFVDAFKEGHRAKQSDQPPP